jgi:hypothetical protein
MSSCTPAAKKVLDAIMAEKGNNRCIDCGSKLSVRMFEAADPTLMLLLLVLMSSLRQRAFGEKACCLPAACLPAAASFR